MLKEPTPSLEGDDVAELEAKNPNWLAIADEAYRTSTGYLDENYRKQWEKNISNFRCEHPPGSKYHSPTYKARSRLFRPKTRSAVRKAEATFAQAMFATTDVITLEPVDQSSKEEDVRTEIWQAILNYRLKNSIPWFVTSIGALQETKNYGIVISRQDWVYDVMPGEVIEDEETGEVTEVPETVLADHPRCELIEIENIRFDPAAKWYDPVGTSPYFIELMPMYIGDVMEMMEANDPKTGEPAWIKYELGEILAAGRKIELAGDTTKKAREGQGRSDPNDTDHKVREFEKVWVHRNFVRKNGVDWEYYTLTNKKMLSEPQPATSVLGRPYRIGISSIEAHKCIPAGDVELSQGLQSEANTIVNQRLDNVKLVLNKGYIVGQKSSTDLATLKRSYPGRIVMTDDINAIKPDDTSDVTGSSYQEQDRVNADMDDLVGGFSSGSVMTNRSLNETVGGMNRIAQSSNDISGYSIRIFVETWVEPVLSDITKLIQAHESDDIIARFVAEKGMVERPSRQEMILDTTASVSIGFGEMDPKARSVSMSQGLQTMGAIAPWAMGGIDVKMVAKEIFAPVGLRDGSKFFKQLPEGPPEPPPDPMVALKEQEIAVKREIELTKAQGDFRIKTMELALKEKLTMEQLYSRLELDQDKYDLEILKEMGRREEVQAHREEMHLKTLIGEGV